MTVQVNPFDEAVRRLGQPVRINGVDPPATGSIRRVVDPEAAPDFRFRVDQASQILEPDVEQAIREAVPLEQAPAVQQGIGGHAIPLGAGTDAWGHPMAPMPIETGCVVFSAAESLYLRNVLIYAIRNFAGLARSRQDAAMVSIVAKLDRAAGYYNRREIAAQGPNRNEDVFPSVMVNGRASNAQLPNTGLPRPTDDFNERVFHSVHTVLPADCIAMIAAILPAVTPAGLPVPAEPKRQYRRVVIRQREPEQQVPDAATEP